MPAPSRPMIGARSLMDAKAYRERAAGAWPRGERNFLAQAGRLTGHEDLARSSRRAGRDRRHRGRRRSPGADRASRAASHARGTAPFGTPVVSLLGTGGGAGAGGRRHARDARPGADRSWTAWATSRSPRCDSAGPRHPSGLPARGGPDLALDHGGGGRQPVRRLASIPARRGRPPLGGIGFRQRVPGEPAGWARPHVRGTSEAFSVAGRVQPFSSETGPADPYGGPAEPDSAVREAIAQAAARARFRVVSISLMHPNRQAATSSCAPSGGRRSRAATDAFFGALDGADRPAGRPPVAGRRPVRLPGRSRLGRHLDEPALALPEPLRPRAAR